ncbi:MAG: DoxX family protein [bacterium]
MRVKSVAYWTTTALVVFAMMSGGIAELLRLPANVEGMVHLGYPVYFVTIIGTWKVLGAVALVLPGFGRLKEWAYAGIVFNMTGAAASHIAVNDARWHIAATLTIAALALASWALRPESRSLGDPTGWWRRRVAEVRRGSVRVAHSSMTPRTGSTR